MFAFLKSQRPNWLEPRLLLNATARGIGKFLVGVAIGGLILWGIGLRHEPVIRDSQETRVAEKSVAYVTASAWKPAPRFKINDAGRIEFDSERVYVATGSTIEESAATQFLNGNREMALRIVEAINGDLSKARALSLLLDRVRVLHAYKRDIDPQDFAPLIRRADAADETSLSPGADIAPAPTPDHTHRLVPEFQEAGVRFEDTPLKFDSESLRDAVIPTAEQRAERTRLDERELRVEKQIVSNAATAIARIKGIVDTLDNTEKKATVLFEIANNEGQLGRRDAADAALEAGIRTLSKSRPPLDAEGSLNPKIWFLLLTGFVWFFLSFSDGLVKRLANLVFDGAKQRWLPQGSRDGHSAERTPQSAATPR